MKKAFSLVIVLSMALATMLGITVQPAAFAAQEELRIYNWAEYMDLSIIEEFEAYYKETTGRTIELKYSTFDTNETMLTNVLKGNAEVDLICPSEYALERLVFAGALEPLDKTRIPNAVNIDSRITEKVDSVFGNLTVGGQSRSLNDFFLPYMWGTLGILYNTDIVTDEDLAAGWGLLWNKEGNRKLEDKILFKDSIRDAYVAAVLYLKENDNLPAGYENKSVQQLINTVDGVILDAVEAALKEQKKHLKDYEVDFGKDAMVTGKAYADLAWSGDALWAMEFSDKLDYFLPEVGSNIWFDGWAIPKKAPNKAAAYVFIDYLCNPDIAMRNSMEIGYTNALSPEALLASAEAVAILEDNDYDADEYFSNELRYPVIDEKLGVMRDFGDMNETVVAMWERVKSEGSKTWILIVVIVVIAAAIGGAVAFFLLKNKKGKRVVRRTPAPSTGGQEPADPSAPPEADDKADDGE